MNDGQYRPVLSHVDVRVRDRVKAIAFYDAVLGAIGMSKSMSDEWTAYGFDDNAPTELEVWFGFTVDPNMVAGSSRIALAAETCEAVDHATKIAMEAGAKNIEGPDYDYGPEYYAVFFEDPDGNKLEICCRGPRAKAAG